METDYEALAIDSQAGASESDSDYVISWDELATAQSTAPQDVEISLDLEKDGTWSNKDTALG